MWRFGPLPFGTYGWGAVVLVGQAPGSFYFATFQGDRALLPPASTGEAWRTVGPGEVAAYNNSLAPPNLATAGPWAVPSSREEERVQLASMIDLASTHTWLIPPEGIAQLKAVRAEVMADDGLVDRLLRRVAG